MTIRRTLTPKSLIQILSLCTSREGEQICRSSSYMATLQFLNLLLPSISIHLEIGFIVYWPVMTFSGQRKWIPLGIQDLVAGDTFFVIKLVVSHYVVSIQVSMMMVSGYVCGNVCLSVMMICGDPRCEPFWCDPFGSFVGMMDVMRYFFCLCLCVCLSVYMACQMVMMVTLVVHKLWLLLCDMALDQLCFLTTSSPFERLQYMICHEPSPL